MEKNQRSVDKTAETQVNHAYCFSKQHMIDISQLDQLADVSSCPYGDG